MDDEIAKLKALKAELGSSGQNWAVDKKLSGSKEGPKPGNKEGPKSGNKEGPKSGSKEGPKKPPPVTSQTGAPVQDPRVKEQGDLVRRLKSAKVAFFHIFT